MSAIPNLASQHCDPPIAEIWSDKYLIELEWSWWLNVMQLQRQLGLDIVEPYHLEASRSVLFAGCRRSILDRIDEVERRTHHDLMARLQVFCELAGHERHHLGLTSADVVENAMQIRVRKSVEWLDWKYDLDVSHLDQYYLRGVHGPVGTDQDQLDLLGSAEAVCYLNERLAMRFGFSRPVPGDEEDGEPLVCVSVPQVMHRSADLAVLTPLVSQVKERVGRDQRWARVFGGYVTMMAGYAGDTWNEGDVSSSVVRRVALPNLLMSLSAALRETSLDSRSSRLFD